MNIAINTLALYKIKAGMGNYIFHLVKEVISADTSQKNKYFIYVSNKNREYFKELSVKENIRLISVPNIFLSYYGKLFFEQCIIPFDLMKKRIEIYHAPGFALPLISISKGVKYVVTIADMTFFSHSQYHLAVKKTYFRWMIPRSIKKADAVIAISESTKQDICKYIPEAAGKTWRLYLGVDKSFTEQRINTKKKDSKPKESNVREKYWIKKEYILYVGVLEPRKNVEGLICAFAEIKKTNKNISLVIAGKKGWMYENIFALVEKLGLKEDIIFTDYVADNYLYWLYKNALCFCYPSFYEGFGLPVLEAMAVGCPVITSNISSLKEIAEGAAILIDPHNQKQLISALETLLKNKGQRDNLVQKGKKRAEQFSWEKMGKETLALYEYVYLYL